MITLTQLEAVFSVCGAVRIGYQQPQHGKLWHHATEIHMQQHIQSEAETCMRDILPETNFATLTPDYQDAFITC